MVVLVVLTILLSGLALPLAAQLNLRRMDETRRQLDEAKEALLGFVAPQGRLPCPAAPRSLGLESFAAGEDAASGGCSAFPDGFLPGATPGPAPPPSQGYVRAG